MWKLALITATEFTTQTLDAASRKFDGKGPVFMLNLLRFRKKASYDDPTDLPPCSGQEAYLLRYVPAFNKAAEGEAIVVSWLGKVHATIVAPDGETWDHVAIVEYPSFDVLRRVIESPQYKTNADPHRRAALEDWRFIATTKTGPPQ